MYSSSRKFGNKGEEIAVKFIESKGFSIIDRNYLRKFGEIDIVAKKDGKVTFIEVKSVSREILSEKEDLDEFRPEDNVNAGKVRNLRKVIEAYLHEKDLIDSDWSFSVVTVKIDDKNKVAKVKLLEDIVL